MGPVVAGPGGCNSTWPGACFENLSLVCGPLLAGVNAAAVRACSRICVRVARCRRSGSRMIQACLGVSDDTLRRWADGGRVETTTDTSGRLAVDGIALARLASELAEAADDVNGGVVV